MDIVTVQNLHKTFGKGESAVHALCGISLALEKGKFTAIIGASGSGKIGRASCRERVSASV